MGLKNFRFKFKDKLELELQLQFQLEIKILNVVLIATTPVRVAYKLKHLMSAR